MTPFEGLPDFQNPLTQADLALFAPFGQGQYMVLPKSVEVARDAGGRPKFQLRLMKHTGDTNPAGEYGVMDVSLAGEFAIDDALTAVRAVAPGGTVAGASIQSGFARLYPTNDAVSLAAEMTAPVALGQAGSDLAEWTMRLPLAAAELVAGALSDSSLLFGARLEYGVAGVAPRVPVFVQFAPAKLIAALLQGKPARQVAVTDITALCTAPPGTLPFTVVGQIEDPVLFGQAMADRVIAAWGSLVPAPDIAAPPYVTFPPADQVETATIQWDLRQATAASRYWAMVLDPLTALRAAAKANGVESLVKRVAIPPLDLGLARIDLAASLPVPRAGVPAIGVTVSVPANPPDRPSAESVTVTFAPPDQSGKADIRFAPNEPMAYDIATFAVLASGHTVHRYARPARRLTTAWVQLQSGDFPVAFVRITAEVRLLALCKIAGTLRCALAGKPLEQPFALTAAAPTIALGIPEDATNRTIALSAAPMDGGPALTLPQISLAMGNSIAPIRLDFNSFSEYGPHMVSIDCRMDAGDAALFVEFLAETNIAGSAAVPAKFAFTPQQSSNRWGYVAQSPFRAGYRFRTAVSGNEQPKPWSAIQSPFGALHLDANGSIVATAEPAAAPLATAASLSETG
jgi:hypothetical protein